MKRSNLEGFIILVSILGDNPLFFPTSFVNTLESSDTEWALVVALESTTFDNVLSCVTMSLLFARNHVHQPCDVLGQHAVDRIEQLLPDRIELGEVLMTYNHKGESVTD